MDKPDLYRDLSYKLIGVAMKVHADYGANHKEKIYERALSEKLDKDGVKFVVQPKIPVYSIDSGAQLGWYQPDFLIDDKIIVEIKATNYPIKAHEIQLSDYLKRSKVELGYLINFGQPSLYYRRMIWTNDRKIW